MDKDKKGFDEDVASGVLVVRESNQVFDFNLIPGFTETTGLIRQATFHGFKQKISDCVAGMSMVKKPNRPVFTLAERDAKRQTQFDAFVEGKFNVKRVTGGKSIRNDYTLAKKMGVDFEIAYKTINPTMDYAICKGIWDSIEI